eukprot:scaffold2234_cov151-Cylindrotheca_fusiformis.AAC.1
MLRTRRKESKESDGFQYSRCCDLTIPCVISRSYRYFENIGIVLGVWGLAPTNNGGLGACPQLFLGVWGNPPAGSKGRALAGG